MPIARQSTKLFRPIIQNKQLVKSFCISSTLNGGDHHDREPLLVDLQHKSTMDYLAAPSGSWKKNYDTNQKIYNLLFIGGVGGLVGTMLFFYSQNLFDWNWNPGKSIIKNKDFPGAKYVDAKEE
ncbi:hypothetical protein SNEBB_001286 [Seison nebaliae]|nr:hypothetical protein SNEBB_001286 [Seison nebaliae]